MQRKSKWRWLLWVALAPLWALGFASAALCWVIAKTLALLDPTVAARLNLRPQLNPKPAAVAGGDTWE